MRATPWFGAACLVFLLAASALAQHQTVGEHTAIRMDLSYDLGPHGGMLEYAATQLGYRLDKITSNGISNSPDVLVGDVTTALSRGYGLVFPHSHMGLYPGYTDAGLLLVEPFLSSTERNNALTDYLNGGYSWSDLLPFSVQKTGYTIYGIAISTFLIAGVYTDQGSFVYVDGCNSNCLSSAFVGRKAFIGYNHEVQANVALNDANMLLGNMAGWNGVSKRPLSEAWQGTTLAAPSGATNVVLAPIVISTDLPSGPFYNDDGFSFEFDCSMNTNVPASDVLKGLDSFEITDAVWLGNTTVAGIVRSRYAGPGAVVVNSDTTVRNCCGARSAISDIPLDGNQDGPNGQVNGYPPNGDPFTVYLTAMYGNPAAVIASLTAFRQQGGVDLNWWVELENNTKTWLVEYADDPAGPYTVVQEVPANGGPTYSAFDPGRTSGHYRLREVEGTGDTLSYEPTEVSDPFTPEAEMPITVNADSLLTAMQSDHGPLLSPDRVPETYIMTIVVPDSMKDIPESLAADHSEDGDFTDITVLESVGGMAGLTEYLHTRASQGLQYVLYGGGSKYIAPWQDLLNWSPNRVGWNFSGQASYIAYPQWNILNFPFTIDPADSQAVSRAWWTSFSEDYGLVTDFDGDSITDLRIGVLPANNRAELTLMVAKQRAAKRMPKTGYPQNQATFWTYAVNNGRNRGDAIAEYGDSLYQYMSATPLTVQRLTATNAVPYTYAQREQMSINAFNAGRSLFINLGTFGNRSRNGWIDQVSPGVGGTPWSWSKTNADSQYSFYVGDNCGQMDDVRPYDPNYGPGYMKRAMVDLQHNSFWGGCGWDAGSFLYGNFLYGKHFFLRYASGARSGGDINYLAVRDVAFQYPEWKPLMRENVFFGDPLIPLAYQTVSYNVGVDDGVMPMSMTLMLSPNPSRGATSIRFALPSETEASLKVYDVQGRLVRNLGSARFSAGSHALQWDGRDESGTPVSTGIHFIRVEAGGTSVVQKVIIIR